MLIKTGITITEIFLSFDTSNNPVSAATFTQYFYINGTLTTSIIPTISLINSSAATFSITWSASTYGMHQLHVKNNNTSALYISDLYNVRPDTEVDPSPSIYVGL